MAEGKQGSLRKKPEGKSPVGRKPAKRKTESGNKSPAFPVVGIGASAGGLEALNALFEAMPETSPAAFVVVSHLDPKHISLMPELLQQHSKMPVIQIQDGIEVEAGRIYIIPPNHDLYILNGTLQLMQMPEKRSATLPIDTFFTSLAQDQGANAVAIVLSGTGSDGSKGIKSIKAEQGMVMVQTIASAKYDGMPHCAIATGLADYILKPESMPQQLHRYLKFSPHRKKERLSLSEGAVPDALQKIFIILRSRTHHDFSLYKKNTICRRIERRMNVHQLENIADYVRYLQESESETAILLDELLINVTNMFRDPEAFDVLVKQGLIPMMKEKPDEYTFRVWVAGCSSGEEAYSIAIAFFQSMAKLNRHFQLQIFATDIDEKAIATARQGIYPATIEADVGKDRLKRFFRKQDDGSYMIHKMVRETVVFAPQNLIKDPPFTRLDLLCCRNLLIYLGAELQKRLLPIFHYSLNPGGLLFLGTSETIGSFTDHFKALDRKWKVFHKLSSSAAQKSILSFPAMPVSRGEMEVILPDSIQSLEEISAFQLVEAILQQSDAPPCAIIDKADNITYIHGKTGKFLEPAEGKVTINILEMVRPGLKKELAAAIHEVRLHKRDVICKSLQVAHDGGYIYVDMLVKPILEPAVMHGMLMVVFEQTMSGDAKQRPKQKRAKGRAKTVEELEQELRFTREHLQSTIEELETANEELKSTNEELQSTNEELQSTNEELETSKEELQSLNEESVTVNAELQSRIDELSTANDDMKNLLDSTNIATLFLDADLCVRRFTSAVTELIPLTASDAGRPVRHFATNLLDTDLAIAAARVLDELSVIAKETVSRDGAVYQMRLRPYRTLNNVIDGVVITFEEITVCKRAEQKALLAKQFAENIVATIRQPLLLLNKQFTIVTANPAFCHRFSLTLTDVVGESIYTLAGRQWDVPELHKLLEEVLSSDTAFEAYRYEHFFEGIGNCAITLNGRKIVNAAAEEEEELILLELEEITVAENG